MFPYVTPSSAEFSHMRAGGVGAARIAFCQCETERVQGTYNWRRYDGIVGRAARSGVSVAPVLLGVPAWMSPQLMRMPIDSPAQEASWSAFVAAAAERYGPGGTFWSANPGLVAQPIVHWEVWNEPNISGFVAGPPSARRYARLLQITHAALRAGNPATRTMVAGLYRRPAQGKGPPMNVFLSRLYRVKRVKNWFDAVGVHPYGTSSRQVLKVVRKAREVMDANQDRRATIWVTEIGWTTGGDQWAQSLYRATPEEQARRLARSYISLIRERRRLRLRQITWHAWRDWDGPRPVEFVGWVFQMGVFTSAGQPKPAWKALTRIAGGVPTGPIPDAPAPSPARPPSPQEPPPNPEEACIFPGLLC